MVPCSPMFPTHEGAIFWAVSFAITEGLVLRGTLPCHFQMTLLKVLKRSSFESRCLCDGALGGIILADWHASAPPPARLPWLTGSSFFSAAGLKAPAGRETEGENLVTHWLCFHTQGFLKHHDWLRITRHWLGESMVKMPGLLPLVTVAWKHLAAVRFQFWFSLNKTQNHKASRFSLSTRTWWWAVLAVTVEIICFPCNKSLQLLLTIKVEIGSWNIHLN